MRHVSSSAVLFADIMLLPALATAALTRRRPATPGTPAATH